MKNSSAEPLWLPPEVLRSRSRALEEDALRVREVIEPGLTSEDDLARSLWFVVGGWESCLLTSRCETEVDRPLGTWSVPRSIEISSSGAEEFIVVEGDARPTWEICLWETSSSSSGSGKIGEI